MTDTSTTPAAPPVVHRRQVPAAFGKAWARSPEDDRHQLTHAVDTGLRIALCGVSTTVRRGTWPDDATMWDSPLGRCPVCARVVYGSSERRH